MPTPEELGLRSVAVAVAENPVDWTTVRGRLNGLGAECFQLQKSTDGLFLFVIFLPGKQPGQSHRIEAQAEGEADAVRLVLERAEVVARGQ